DVRVVARRALVLHVRGRDRDAAGLLLMCTVDRVVGMELAAETLRTDLRQRRRQRRLAVVHVTDRAHVHVGLGALELTLGHDCVSRLNWWKEGRARCSGPKVVLTNRIEPST